jgi:hypothetical protein
MRVRAAALVCLLAVACTLAGCSHKVEGGVDDPPRSEPPHGGLAAASCVGPYLDDQPPDGRFGAPAPTVHPGESLQIHGHWYTSTCNDTGGHDPLEPLSDVRLTVTFPGGETQELGPFTPTGTDVGFKATVAVPADTAGGPVTVTDGLGHIYEFGVSGSRNR